nr:hypothetical protein [Tanacetum cinerariifolium]
MPFEVSGYPFYSFEFDLNESNTEQNNDSGSELDDDDYNVYDYCSSAKSDTTSIDHLSEDEEEFLEVRTKKVGPAHKKKDTRMFGEKFLTNIFNRLPRDDFDDSNDPKTDDQDMIGDHWPIHDPNIKWKFMRPCLWERFEDPEQLKRALAYYALSNSYKLYYKLNNPRRLVAKCSKDSQEKKCPFMTFEYGSLITSNWIARNYAKKITTSPTIKVRDIVASVLKKYKCKVFVSLARRGKIKALQQYETCLEDHYEMLLSYAVEILASNEGSTCKIGVDIMANGKTYFSSFYICFKALKEGWLEGCRRVIGLDGCFLKTICKGGLLSAVDRDGNNQIYPIAWVMVSVENKKNWSWFMQCLTDDLGIVNGKGLTIISDQHKGIIEAAKAVISLAEHKQCARHIYDNFRKNTGVQFRNLFWKAAKAIYPAKFERVMTVIRDISKKAHTHLMERNTESWSRAYIRTDISCDVIENGITIYFLHKDPEDYVSEWYTKERFVSSYNHYIEGMNGMDQWTITSYQKPLPPIERRMPGRPPHKRKIDFSKKDGNMSRISRKGQVNHCTICGATGHNQRACPSKGLKGFATGVNPPPMSARAVDRDGNNQIYPIAWVMVSVENKKNWSWFMQCLTDDLGIVNGEGLTIISDQHKGIIEAAKAVISLAEHKQCARHISANFRKNTGVQFRNLFWKAAKAIYPAKFERVMTVIRDISKKAHTHLMERNTESWSRAYIRTDISCDVIENGITIYFLHKDPEDYVSEWYTKERFVSSYNHYIEGMNGMDQWTITSYQKPLPPIERRMPGRPPHKRKIDFSKKDGNMSRISRKGQVNHCTICGATGHNQRACPSKGLKGFATGVNPPLMSARGGKISNKGGKTPSVSSRGGKEGWCIHQGGRGDGSKSKTYPSGIRPIGYGVSWDPVDGETMLGIPWPVGITPEVVRIRAQQYQPEAIMPLSGSQPLSSQEE